MTDDFLARALGRADLKTAPSDATAGFQFFQNANDLETTKPLSQNDFYTFSTFSKSDLEADNSADPGQSGGRAAGAGGRARTRDNDDLENMENVEKRNNVSGVPILSLFPKRRENGKTGKSEPDHLTVAGDWFEERAAVREFDGGMTRTDAEAAARADVTEMIADGRIPSGPTRLPPPLF